MARISKALSTDSKMHGAVFNATPYTQKLNLSTTSFPVSAAFCFGFGFGEIPLYTQKLTDRNVGPTKSFSANQYPEPAAATPPPEYSNTVRFLGISTP